MLNTNLKLSTDSLIFWFDAIREHHNDTKFMDAFWDEQIKSKCWLVNGLNTLNIYKESNVYVFGGWIGILSSMLLQCTKFPINKIISIDIDPWCKTIATDICRNYKENKFEAKTDDMALYTYEDDLWPDIVINTSTEHVDQITYDRWYEKIPTQTLVVVQGNNFFSCDQHVRCSHDLDNFLEQNKCVNPLLVNELNLASYKRYMAIWRKI